MDTDKKPTPDILQVLQGKQTRRPPIWLMRQAGRYLPEYREIRSTAPSFLEFCYTPRLAVEATLQPIRRFGFDAAILFSDILVIPDALGQKVSFETGEGPRLNPIDSIQGIQALDANVSLDRLGPVYETIERVRAKLSDETALLGFCGAPWTVASYMIAGKGTPDQAPARLFAYKHPDLFEALIDIITEASIKYLIAQLKAGVDAVQIFDSWAGVLPAGEFESWCYKPVEKIVAEVRKAIPNAPIIAFPRGSGVHLPKIAKIEGLSGIGLDTSVDPAWASKEVQSILPVQGNLDPLALLAGGKRLDQSIDYIIKNLSQAPFIFNLGHGILPPTPIENVVQLIKRVKG